jgi:hypothetical protein
VFGRFAGILLVLLSLSGCSSSDGEFQAIRQVLAIRSKALNSRDLSGYLSVVSPQYNDKGKDFKQLRESLDKNFREYKKFSYEAENPSISVNGGSAESVSSYRMNVEVKGQVMTLKGVERLKLAKEPEGWKVIAGI